MSTLKINLLGDFRIEYQGSLFTTIDSARLQSALAYLVLNCQTPQLRSHVAFQLWPDSSERQARNNLRKVLHLLRSALAELAGGEWFVTDAKNVQWRSAMPSLIDVFEFEGFVTAAGNLGPEKFAEQQHQLAQAVALYHGDLLPSCYDEWILPQREQLRQLLIETLARLVWLAEEQRDYATAIHYAQQLLQRDPLHEATYRRLMRLEMLAGNRAGALHTYHSCVTLFQRELGVEPGPAMKQAYAALLEMEVPSVIRNRAEGTIVGQFHLAGRQAEWRTLLALWRKAAQGQCHFGLIAGEAGIGKTRLAEELLTWAERQGIATARTRAYTTGQGLAYGPVVEWLRSKPLQPMVSALDELRLVEVARLLPELLTDRTGLVTAMPTTTRELNRWERQRLFDTLTGLLLRYRKPLLLLIDDLQWCDGETLAWLRYLFGVAQRNHDAQIVPAHLLIVGTVRPEEVTGGHPLKELLLDLRSANQVTEITLHPLTKRETIDLALQVADTTLDSAILDHIVTQTEGNPLFVVEWVRAGLRATPEQTVHELQAQGADSIAAERNPLSPPSPTILPPKVLAVIQSRLARLSADAHNLAAVAAVIGRSFTFPLLQAVGLVNEHLLVNGLDELWQRGIIRTHGEQRYDFSHDRIRDVAYGEISPVQQPILHRQVARALETLYGAEIAPVCAQLAFHYEKAGDWTQSISYYQQAATVAHNRFADTEGANLLSHALTLTEHLPKAELRKEQELSILLQLYVAVNVSKGLLAPELRDICMSASQLAQELGRLRDLLTALAGLRSFYQMCGHYREALAFAVQMRTLAVEFQTEAPLPSTGDVALLAHAYSGLGTVYFYMGQLSEARAHFEQANALPQRRTVLPIFSAMNSWLLGYPDRARREMHQALVIARSAGYPYDIGFAMTNLARLNHFLRRNQLAKLWAQRAIALCSTYEIPFWVKLGNLFLGRALVESGEVAQGLALLQRTLAQLDEDGHQAFCSYFWGLLAEAYGELQQYEDALAALDRGLSYVERNGEGFWHPELLRLRGAWRAAQGAPIGEVERCYREAIAVAQGHQGKALELRATVSLCRLWQAEGKIAEAHALLSTVYHWFTEGHRTADLQIARNLLNDLKIATDKHR